MHRYVAVSSQATVVHVAVDSSTKALCGRSVSYRFKNSWIDNLEAPEGVDRINATVYSVCKKCLAATPAPAPVEEPTGNITWKRGDYASQRGLIGDVQMFVINRAVSGPGWTVHCSVPGYKTYLQADDEVHAKRKCESIVNRFMTRIGASFKDA